VVTWKVVDEVVDEEVEMEVVVVVELE